MLNKLIYHNSRNIKITPSGAIMNNFLTKSVLLVLLPILSLNACVTIDESMKEAISIGTAESLQEFLDSYPVNEENYDERNRVIFRLANIDFDQAQEQNTLKSFEMFIDKYENIQGDGTYYYYRKGNKSNWKPNISIKDLVRWAKLQNDDLSYIDAEKQNTPQSYKAYMTKYPKGQNLSRAKQGIDKLVYSNYNSLDELKLFIVEHPDNYFIGDAKDRIIKLLGDTLENAITQKQYAEIQKTLSMNAGFELTDGNGNSFYKTAIVSNDLKLAELLIKSGLKTDDIKIKESQYILTIPGYIVSTSSLSAQSKFDFLRLLTKHKINLSLQPALEGQSLLALALFHWSTSMGDDSDIWYKIIELIGFPSNPLNVCSVYNQYLNDSQKKKVQSLLQKEKIHITTLQKGWAIHAMNIVGEKEKVYILKDTLSQSYDSTQYFTEGIGKIFNKEDTITNAKIVMYKLTDSNGSKNIFLESVVRKDGGQNITKARLTSPEKLFPVCLN